MVQNGYVIQDDPFASTLPPRALREFSATRAIGGKLRALYDDTPQPCPNRITNLLAMLKITSLVSH